MGKRSLAIAAIILICAAASAIYVWNRFNYSMARAAGDLAGQLAWAQDHCRGAAAPGVREALEGYRKLSAKAYGDGFAIVQAQLASTQSANIAMMCDWLVEPYRKVRSSIWLDDLGASLLKFPEPAWRDKS
jgi:hypothetical protein